MRTLIMKKIGNKLCTIERFTTVNKSVVDVVLCESKIKTFPIRDLLLCKKIK